MRLIIKPQLQKPTLVSLISKCPSQPPGPGKERGPRGQAALHKPSSSTLHAGAWGPWQEMGSGQEAQTPARRPHGVPVLPWTGHLTSVGLWDPPQSLPGLGWGSSEIRPGEMGLFLYRFVWRFWGLNRASALPPNHTLARDAKLQR